MHEVDKISSLMFILGKHIYKGVFRDIDNVKLEADESYKLIRKFEQYEKDIDQLYIWVLNQDI